MTDPACVTSTVCVEDAGGAIQITTDAADRSTREFKTTRELASSSGAGAISCPSLNFCAAVDTFGELIASTDPTGGSEAWHVVPGIDGGHGLLDI